MPLIYLRYRPRRSGYYWVTICINPQGSTETHRHIERIVKAFSSCQDGDSPESHAGRVPNKVCWEGDVYLIEDPRFLAFAGPIPSPEPWRG